ncbi:MAG: OB-fold nucleic acid binding domain-containing protein [Halobacteriaceae archaeon]
MGSCIICGKSVDGVTCRSHQEDVAFEFRGTSPDQLETDRYYRGTVDGFADFGVFVNIGDRVTGLLHRSEVEGRLESLDWEEGDEVFVQVTGVHDNGNVDLGWSIRESEREFRGKAIHDPSAEEPEVPVEGLGETPGAETEEETAAEEQSGSRPEREAEAEAEQAEPEAEEVGEAEEAEAEAVEAVEEEAETETAAEGDLDRTPIEELGDRVGDEVRLEAEVAGVRQTGGPTVFALNDETGRVDCAAFVGAGERAYPEIEVGDVVSLVGEVERRQGELQVETESIEVLDGDARAAVEARLDAALESQAEPSVTELLTDEGAVADAREGIVDAATAIRRAVIESRPVVVRHTATVSGYLAGAAIERAVLPLVRDRHAESDAEYHYVDRRPLDGQFYEMDDATKDVTDLLQAAERHGENRPLVVLADVGHSRESRDALDLLDTYDVPRAVIDTGEADARVADAVDVFLTVDDPEVTTAALAANVATVVNHEVRDDLLHLPAVSYWDETPDRYADLATRAGYDAAAADDLRGAIAMQAHYQTYEDKREIVQDLLWGEDRAFASHVASQFHARLDDELDTVDSHVEERTEGGVPIHVVDVEAFTHRYDFPPSALLLDALYREARDDGPVAVVGLDEDELHVRAPVDVQAVGGAVADALPEAGVRPRGTRDGYVEFLRGERDAVLDAAVDEIADRLAAGVEAPARD